MLRLGTADRPDVLCVQEVPAWALGRLGRWVAMREVHVLAARPALGPVPITAALGRVLTAPHHGLWRSAFAGQGNAILLDPSLRVVEEDALVLNPRRFRDVQARWLGLDWVA